MEYVYYQFIIMYYWGAIGIVHPDSYHNDDDNKKTMVMRVSRSRIGDWNALECWQMIIPGWLEPKRVAQEFLEFSPSKTFARWISNKSRYSRGILPSTVSQ